MAANAHEVNSEESSVNLLTFLSLLMAMVIGLLLAVLVLPVWLPGMASSLSGDAPRAFWYLSRSSAFAAPDALLRLRMLFITVTERAPARKIPSRPLSASVLL